jgi:hypothetical protein
VIAPLGDGISTVGRYREREIHDELIRIKGIDSPVRQLAIRNIGREHPTMLITNAHDLTTKQLFGRYAERMTIENELDAYIQGFHLNALSSGLPLNVDLDATLTVDLDQLIADAEAASRVHEPITLEEGDEKEGWRDAWQFWGGE